MRRMAWKACIRARRLGLDVRRLAGELGRCGMDPLPLRVQERVTGCCASQSISRPGCAPAAPRDGHVTRPGPARSATRGRARESTAGGVAHRSVGEAARRVAARPAVDPFDEVAEEQVEATGSRTLGMWPDPSSSTNSAPKALSSSRPRLTEVTSSSALRMTSEGQVTASAIARATWPTSGPSSKKGAMLVRMSVSASVSSPQPTASSMGLVECGSLKQRPKKNRRKSGKSWRQ